MWQCTKCQEKLEDTFDACWNCGTERDGTEDPEFDRRRVQSVGQLQRVEEQERNPVTEAEWNLKSLSDLAKPIFVKWESLRILYNLIMVAAIVLTFAPYLGNFFLHYAFLGVWISALFWANLLFFLAPILEAYIAWLGEKSFAVTAVIFCGCLVVALPFVMRYARMTLEASGW